MPLKYLFFAFILIAHFTNAQETKRVLFLGNSYTFANDLPKMVSELAKANGDTLIYDQNTPGGYSFEQHYTNATTLSKIKSQKWDYVVLQDQSQKPSFSPSQVASDVYPYADSLVKKIRMNSECSTPLFFITWGRQHGDRNNCQFYPPICTFEGMQGRLRSSYMNMTETHKAKAAPVGVAWRLSLESDSTIILHSSDESHPNTNGTYLAACVFYASIFDKSPIANTYQSTLGHATANQLQTIAKEIALDSAKVWDYSEEMVKADMDFKVSIDTVRFMNKSNKGKKALWDFGDGSTSDSLNPMHIYQDTGIFTVRLISFGNCESDTIYKSVEIELLSDITNTGFWNIKSKKGSTFYPNPFKNYVIVSPKSKAVYNLQIFDLYGRIVYSSKKSIGKKRVITQTWKKGIYIAKLTFNKKIISQKIIKK